eukprot:TRINITY_DN12612_c0_g2_i8.p3 TRINITY_DN12612_c0_g2~~TRINITY_DN12612_c0_g2_i8.p3  ORF type:complete len:106 (+),score=19.12 TRINITY_DN12612_c0_g2_i8:901-1218(+)
MCDADVFIASSHTLNCSSRSGNNRKKTPSSAAKAQAKRSKSSASLKKPSSSKSQTQLEVPEVKLHPFLLDHKHDENFNWTCKGNRELKFLNLSCKVDACIFCLVR